RGTGAEAHAHFRIGTPGTGNAGVVVRCPLSVSEKTAQAVTVSKRRKRCRIGLSFHDRGCRLSVEDKAGRHRYQTGANGAGLPAFLGQGTTNTCSRQLSGPPRGGPVIFWGNEPGPNPPPVRPRPPVTARPRPGAAGAPPGGPFRPPPPGVPRGAPP